MKRKLFITILSFVLAINMMPSFAFAGTDDLSQSGEKPSSQSLSGSDFDSVNSARDEAKTEFGIDDKLIFESEATKASELTDEISQAAWEASKVGENEMAMVHVNKDIAINTSIFVEKNVVLVAEPDQSLDFQGEHTVYVEGSVYGGTYNGRGISGNVFTLRGVTSGKNGYIQKVTVVGSAKCGIYAPRLTASAAFLNDKITNCQEDGIRIDNGGTVVRMDGNVIQNCQRSGVFSSEGSDIKSMSNNEIVNNRHANVCVKGTSKDQAELTIDGNNKIIQGSAQGLYANGYCKIKVNGSGNIVEGNAINDVELTANVDFSVSGGMTINPKSKSQWGLRFSNFCNVDLYNTTITGANSVRYDTSCTFKRTNCNITGNIVQDDFFIPKIDSLTAKALNCKSCLVQWKPIEMENLTYLVYRGTSPTGDWGNAIAEVSESRFTDSTVIVNNKYYYMVRPVIKHDGKKVYGEYSNIDYGYPRLNEISGFKAWASGTHTANLSWNKGLDSDAEYWIYRGDAPTGDWGNVHAKVVNGANSFRESVAPSKKYYYMVREAVKGNDGKYYFGPYTPVDYAYPRVATPTGFSAWASDSHTCNCSWNSVAGDNIKYLVYRGSQPTGDWGSAIATLSNGDTKFTDRNMQSGKKYYYMVRAVETYNGKNYYSDYTNVDYAYPR